MKDKLLKILYILIPIAIIVLIIYFIDTSRPDKELVIELNSPEESEIIESAQSLRGFHTLEYLIFKDGKARTIAK